MHCGWEVRQPRRAHNLKVVASNPAPPDHTLLNPPRNTIKPDAPMPSDIADEYAKIKQLGDKKSLSRRLLLPNPNFIVMSLHSQSDRLPKDYADSVF